MVMIDTAIDIASLESVALVDRLKIKECSAVYFLLDAEGVPLYIGSTVHLKTRLSCHRVVRESPENGAVRVAWLPCHWQIGNQIESALIFQLKPRLNQRGKRWQMAPRRCP